MPATPPVDADLRQIAQQLTLVARKKRLSAKELSSLAEVRNRITEVLGTLKECEACGAVVTNIAAVEIRGVRARVCADCGIKALRNNQLRTRKRETTPAPRKKKAAKSGVSHSAPAQQIVLEIPTASEREPVAASESVIDTLSRETGQKAVVIKRIRKIAQDIAMPMTLEGTFNFTRAEARKENLKIDDEQIRSMLRRLAEASEIRVRAGVGA